MSASVPGTSEPPRNLSTGLSPPITIPNGLHGIPLAPDGSMPRTIIVHKRGRGRPRKYPRPGEPLVIYVPLEPTEADQAKKRRAGRPSKRVKPEKPDIDADAIKLDDNVDVTIYNYQGLMTVRDLILFMGKRGLFESGDLTVMQVLLFVKYCGVSRQIDEEEEYQFRKFFTSFMQSRITFVEFVQTLVWASHILIKFDWSDIMKFEYLVEHIDSWAPPPPDGEPAEADDEDEDGEKEDEA